jgi:hypothetical protein
VHRDIFNWVRPKAGPIAFPSLRSGGSVDDFCAGLVAEDKPYFDTGSPDWQVILAYILIGLGVIGRQQY